MIYDSRTGKILVTQKQIIKAVKKYLNSMTKEELIKALKKQDNIIKRKMVKNAKKWGSCSEKKTNTESL